MEEVYKLVTTHMTDSVSHNKGINKILQEMYSLDEPAGQLYCSSHTTLGFSSAMDSLVKKVEEDMKISHFTSKFMVALDVSSKNSSVAGLGLDILLKLVARNILTNSGIITLSSLFTCSLATSSPPSSPTKTSALDVCPELPLSFFLSSASLPAFSQTILRL